MNTLIQDIRYAFRMFIKNRLLTLVAVLSLALGIGANTTVFCWIQNVLLRPVPGVIEPDGLVVVTHTVAGAMYDGISYPTLQDLSGLKTVFSGIFGSQITPVSLTINGEPEWAFGQIAMANFFDVLGVKPLLGRTFLPEEERKPGGHPVVVISEGLWRRRFGGDPQIIGRNVSLNRHDFTIVGVVPSEFRGTMGGLKLDFWAPLMMHEEVAGFGSLNWRADNWMHTMGRLAPGMSLKQAQTAVTMLSRQLERAYPASNRELEIKVLPLWKSPWGRQNLLLPVLRVLMAVSIFVLLIVAANVANLLLSRATSRQKEISIRQALGAGRARLIRQLLTESVLLACLGGLLGTAFALWAAQLFQWFLPKTYLPLGYTLAINGQTLVFTLLVALATGVIFGMAPALQLASDRVSEILKRGGRSSVASSTRHWLRSGLVISEVALALMLLIGAGLCYKGLQQAQRVDPGFDPHHVLRAALRLSFHGYNEATGKVFCRQLLDRLSTLPGVESVAIATYTPLGFEGGPNVEIHPEGYSPRSNEDLHVPYSIISPKYFETMRIPVLGGREFSDRDDEKALRVAIINETMARRFWLGQSPIGRRLTSDRGQTIEVVGVVKNGKYRTLIEPPRPFIYLPYQQGIWDLNLAVHLRAAGDPRSLIPLVRQTVHSLDPAVQVWAPQPLEEYIQASFLAQQVATTLLVVLGILALVLASMGIYGVMAYAVSQRTQELGVRMALGAQDTDVLKLILRQGMLLTLGGMICGLAGAYGLTRLLANFFYGVNPKDTGVFGGVIILLTMVTLAACFLPARRASRVDPLVALRYE